jgi:hypothetical protein
MVKCSVINPADNIRAETADAIRCAARVARQSRAKNLPPAENAPLSQRKSRGAHIAPPENRTAVGGFTRCERRSPKTNMFIRRNSLPKFSSAWRKAKPLSRFADLGRKCRAQ